MLPNFLLGLYLAIRNRTRTDRVNQKYQLKSTRDIISNATFLNEESLTALKNFTNEASNSKPLKLVITYSWVTIHDQKLKNKRGAWVLQRFLFFYCPRLNISEQQLFNWCMFSICCIATLKARSMQECSMC